MAAAETDGRRRKGERRRRALLEATMRVIERAGVAAVSQRVVAAEAGVPPSAVTYYFPAVDDLLLAALTAVNDEYLRLLAACAERDDPLAALAELVASSTPAERVRVAAECELFLGAARRPVLRVEYARWTAALDAFLVPLVADPARRTGVAVAVDGLFVRAYCDPLPVGEVHAVLVALTGRH